MTPKAVTTNSLQSFERRFKSRLQVGLSLARVYRFVAELEPVHGDETDPITGLGAALRAFRRALREGDPEAALDEVERTWAQIEACRQRVIAHDVAIQAYRVRWACENAPLRHQTIGGLAHFTAGPLVDPEFDQAQFFRFQWFRPGLVVGRRHEGFGAVRC